MLPEAARRAAPVALSGSGRGSQVAEVGGHRWGLSKVRLRSADVIGRVAIIARQALLRVLLCSKKSAQTLLGAV